jgi:hypothetical protein
MKVRIKTAHGYLSFQPDGRLEYRPAVGPWEEIDIEGLELPAPISGPVPTPVAVPGPGAIPLPPASPTAGFVAAVKAQLQARGVDLTGACGAFAITKRVAWGLRATGAGLLSKPAGNNCDGFAVDIVAFPTGLIVDILGDAGNGNTPSWNTGEPVEATRYRPAIDPGD